MLEKLVFIIVVMFAMSTTCHVSSREGLNSMIDFYLHRVFSDSDSCYRTINYGNSSIVSDQLPSWNHPYAVVMNYNLTMMGNYCSIVRFGNAELTDGDDSDVHLTLPLEVSQLKLNFDNVTVNSLDTRVLHINFGSVAVSTNCTIYLRLDVGPWGDINKCNANFTIDSKIGNMTVTSENIESNFVQQWAESYRDVLQKKSVEQIESFVLNYTYRLLAELDWIGCKIRIWPNLGPNDIVS